MTDCGATPERQPPAHIFGCMREAEIATLREHVSNQDTTLLRIEAAQAAATARIEIAVARLDAKLSNGISTKVEVTSSRVRLLTMAICAIMAALIKMALC